MSRIRLLEQESTPLDSIVASRISPLPKTSSKFVDILELYLQTNGRRQNHNLLRRRWNRSSQYTHVTITQQLLSVKDIFRKRNRSLFFSYL